MNKKTLFYLTRRSGFLWKSSLILIAVILVLGSAISLLNTGRKDGLGQSTAPPQFFEHELMGEPEGELLETQMVRYESGVLRVVLDGPRAFHEKLELVSVLLYVSEKPELLTIPAEESLSSLSSSDYEVASVFIPAFSGADDGESLEHLIRLGEGVVPVTNANYALALIYESAAEDAEAIAALRREIRISDSDPARQRLVNAYLDTENIVALEQLQAQPDYQRIITPHVRHEIALLKSDWAGIVRTLLPASYSGVSVAMVGLALLSGMIWVTMLWRFNGAISLRALPVQLTLPALALGALSAHATLLCIYWQEAQLNFTMGEDTISQLIYCVLGIGLREEFLKLLFFVPLIPLLIRRSDLEILSVAALVGLGFAIEENISYFEASEGIGALGRFVTANFLHISLTAMCGLTLTRAMDRTKEELLLALTTFGTAVIAHGLYDAFIMVPALLEYSFLSFTVFVLIGYQYFGWLRHLRDEWRDPVSITALFTYGVILVTGLSFCLYAWNAGSLPAFRAVGSQVFSIGVILLLFYREIPETIDAS